MAGKNESTAEHVPDLAGEPTTDTTAVVAVGTALKRFQERQHSLSYKEAAKESWKPLGWCAYMFFICIMFGYDALVGSVVVSIQEFRKDFGYAYDGDYVVSASWQLGFQAAFFVGMIIGGTLTGMAVERFGRQKTIFFAYLVNIGGTFLQYFCTTPAQFFGGKLLTGIPLGGFSTIAPTYASEMAPLAVRGAITAGMNFAIVLGNLLGYGVLRESGHYTGKATYRILFATQWGFIGIALLILPFFPESPYWLVAHGQEEKARHNVVKLHREDFDVDGRMAEVHAALHQQKEEAANQGTIADCFKRRNWKRTMVAMMMFFIQNATGTGWVIGYMSYFMQLAGMSASKSFDATVGISGVMLVGNIFGWFSVEWLGRRGTALYGSFILFITLLIIGILAVINGGNNVLVAQVVFMGVWAFVYQGTLGAAAWPISAENATSWLRTPTQALCTICNALSGSIWGLSLPYAVNPDQGDLQGKIAFIYAALMALAVVFVFFFVPETKGRSYMEIDELWNKGVAPRKFASQTIVPVEVSKEDH